MVVLPWMHPEAGRTPVEHGHVLRPQERTQGDIESRRRIGIEGTMPATSYDVQCYRYAQRGGGGEQCLRLGQRHHPIGIAVHDEQGRHAAVQARQRRELSQVSSVPGIRAEPTVDGAGGGMPGGQVGDAVAVDDGGNRWHPAAACVEFGVVPRGYCKQHKVATR